MKNLFDFCNSSVVLALHPWVYWGHIMQSVPSGDDDLYDVFTQTPQYVVID